MSYWYHATNEYFEKWKVKGIAPELKPELIPHSFISFSLDDELLQGAGSGRCRISIHPDAFIVNLLDDEGFSKQLWEAFRLHPFGSHHVASTDFAVWKDMCATGKILRPHFKPSADFVMWNKQL